jgi:hypothetical protein
VAPYCSEQSVELGVCCCCWLPQVWLATGTDFGGSLRNPASYCGVVGMRNTIGAWPAVLLSVHA